MLIDSERITAADRAHWAQLEHYDDVLSMDPRLDTMQTRAATELGKATTGYIGTTWGKDSVSGDSVIYARVDGKLLRTTPARMRQEIPMAKTWSNDEGQHFGVFASEVEILSPDKLRVSKANPVFAPVRYIMWHEVDKPLYKVTLRNGRSVKVTGDHSVMRLPKRSGGYKHSLEECKTTELRPGEDGMSALFDITDDGTEVDVPDWMLYLAGLWIADGCYARTTKTVISTGGNEAICDFLMKIPRKPTDTQRSLEMFDNIREKYDRDTEAITEVARVVGVSRDVVGNAIRRRDRVRTSEFVTCRVNEKGDAWLYNKDLAEEMRRLGLTGTSRTKRVPEWLYTAARKQIGLFLAGYLDGDAHIGDRGVTVTSVNGELIAGVRELLWRLGILHGYEERHGVSPGGYSKDLSSVYIVTVSSGRSIERFLEWVPTRKATPPSLMRARSRKNPGFQVLQVEEVQKLPASRQTVYDFETGNHMFVANGVVVHNSMVVAHLAATTGSPLPLVWVRLEGLENPDTEPVRDSFLRRFPGVRYEEITIPSTGVRRWWHPEVFDGTDHGPDDGFREAARRHGDHYVSGVRAEESSTRALTVSRNGTHSAGSTRPIARWKGTDVFAYLAKHDLPVHPAYAQTMGGTLDRIQVRVSSIGGVRGTGRHRRLWEETYYPDVVRAAKASL